MSSERILIVDNDEPLLEAVSETLRRSGYEVDVASRPEDAEQAAQNTTFDMFVLDYKMPGKDGIELMKSLRRITPSAEAIIITGYGTIENGVEAIREGARDYLTKPIEGYELVHRVNAIMERRRLRLSLREKDRELKGKYSFQEFVGVSEAVAEVRELANRAAAVLSNVLIEGESGTGKELVARAIHYAGERSEKPFVAVNCGAIAPGIAERELFGHEKGAYTGAHAGRPGYFEAAQGGTLFLDEIGELPLELQVKLLRALDNQEITRVGGTKPINLNVRMLFATNRDLEQMVSDGTFRHDLIFRINVVRITIPPLRERREDIPVLASAFVGRMSQRLKLDPKEISEEAMTVLEDYEWPGNARELENVIERAVALCRGNRIEIEDMPGWLLRGEPMPEGDVESANFMAARRQAQERFDRDFIVRALKRHEGNVSRAADVMGLARSALQRYMRKYGIRRDAFPIGKP